MPANQTVIYGGDPAEAGALDFAARLAAGLDSRAECSYARDPLSALSNAERNEYRTMLEMTGWRQAHDFLIDTSRGHLSELAAEAERGFRMLGASAHVAWGRPLDLAGNIEESITTLAYTRDLLIASFALGDGLREVLQSRALMGVGAPLALIASSPRESRLEDMTVLFAWKPSAAARRALLFSLPLLRRVKQVHLVSIEEEGDKPMVPSAQQIADYLLEAHSVTVQASGLRAADSPALQLAQFYRDVGADLLVMGAYSLPRLQELLFGGFTKHFLARRECNLLLAH